MKVLIFLALVTLSVAQWAVESEDDTTGPFGGLGGGLKIGGLRGLLSSGRYGGIRGLNKIGGPFSRFGGVGQQQWSVPSYGPFVKYGNTVVPRDLLENIINQQRLTPFGGVNTRFGGIDNQGVFGTGLEDFIYGQGIDTPFQYGGINTQYGDQWTNQFDNVMGDDIDQMDILNRVYPLGQTRGQGFTPYSSKARLLGLLTRGIGGLGLKTGLNRKLREVCPEIDGGLSYESCITDAHSKHFKCLKNVEDHPRYLQCTHKPIVKKALRDWFVHENIVQKELIKCLSTTTYADKVKEATIGVPNIERKSFGDLSSEVVDDLTGGQVGYDVQFGVNTKQCFYKLREKVNKCDVLASQCQKFRQCHEHPTIKVLQAKKHVMQTKIVRLLDNCLVGGNVPEFFAAGVHDNIIPELGF